MGPDVEVAGISGDGGFPQAHALRPFVSVPCTKLVPMSHLFAVNPNPSCISWCTVDHGPLDSTLGDRAFSCRRVFVDNDWFHVSLCREIEFGIPVSVGVVHLQVLRDDLPAEQAARLADALGSAAEMLAMDRWDTHGVGTPSLAQPVSKTVTVELEMEP